MTEERHLWERPEAAPVPSSKAWEQPLADCMRPRNLEEFTGQQHLLGPGGPLRRLLEAGHVPGCILYGPPGVGKTSLVRLMASVTDRKLLEVNAITTRVAQLRELVEEARGLKRISGGRSVLVFVDEIYHFNRQQQNALLPSVERGDLVLVGTTTENPYFEINKTLLSRVIVYELQPLKESDLLGVLERALADEERGLGQLSLEAGEGVLPMLARMAGGDARQALTRLEVVARSVAASAGTVLTKEAVDELVPGAIQRFDRASDDHYAVVSALIKSMRGSDPDAAVYWLGRLLAGGEEMRFIGRRLMIFAAEDVGLADPRALSVAVAATQAADMVGLPEARIIFAEAVVYLASAPKSNSAYLAVNAAVEDIRAGELQEVPEHLKPHGSGYQYPHDDERHWLPQKYMNEVKRYYYPGKLGDEVRGAERLKRFWRRFRT